MRPRLTQNAHAPTRNAQQHSCFRLFAVVASLLPLQVALAWDWCGQAQEYSDSGSLLGKRSNLDRQIRP